MKYIEIDNSPFTIVESEETGIMVVMGNNLLGREFETVEKAKEWINSKPWKLILAAACIHYDKVQEILKNEQQ